MSKKKYGLGVLVLGLLLISSVQASVRLKELTRIEGVRDNPIVGYGIVVGLAGTGDTSRSEATMQSVMNALEKFGVTVSRDDINSRNVAAVIITGKLKPFSQVGDKINISVSSLGDARSLVGGTLLMAPLKGANDEIYALAQGQVSVGGFKYDLNGNVIQKNHPTVGLIPEGAIIEKDSLSNFVDKDGAITLLLNSPDFTTVSRAKKALDKVLGQGAASAIHAGKIKIQLPTDGNDVVEWITKIENVYLTPDKIAKIVINERTGTVVAGGGVTIDDVTISHGNIKVIIATDFNVSQPTVINNGIGNVDGNGRTVVVPDTDIDVEESVAQAVDLPAGATISDLIGSLRQIKTSTRDVISILQAIKAAGALHAQLVIQ